VKELDRMAKLAKLAALVEQRELARLAALAHAQKTSEKNHQAAAAARHTVMQRASIDSARIAGADWLWLRWNARELRTLAQASIQAAAKTEDQIARARKAVGRAEALRKMSE